MKNIADVNSEDILTELNNLDYDDDLKLLDDEDIKPINNNNNKQSDDDLADFYMDYSEDKKEEPKIDLYTEKEKVEKEKTPVKVEKDVLDETIRISEVKIAPKNPSPMVASVDDYLNRTSKPKEEKEEPKHADIPNPLINNAKTSPEVKVVPTPAPKPEPVKPMVTPKIESSNQVDMRDLSQLFDKVSNNVKGASEIVNRNAEIKRKIEERFNELRRLQQEHEANKKSDYQEINSYKEEVYAKLQQKKADIEQELVALRSDQAKFNTERKDFETYKSTALANLKTLEKELKDSYDSRNKDIEQVEIGLVKRKEQLDIERSNLAKEREQIEKERAALAENLLQFNKLVDDFTNGVNSFN